MLETSLRKFSPPNVYLILNFTKNLNKQKFICFAHTAWEKNIQRFKKKGKKESLSIKRAQKTTENTNGLKKLPTLIKILKYLKFHTPPKSYQTFYEYHLGYTFRSENPKGTLMCVLENLIFVSNCILHSLTSLIDVLPAREHNYKATLFFIMLDSWFG